MFYDVFTSLCEKKGVSPNKALTDCKISRTSTAKWREGATPRGVTLQKLADYFGVTTDYLLTGEKTKKAPTLTSKDERDIEKRMESILKDLEGQDGLMYSGEPMNDIDRELLATSIRNSMEIGKKLAKQKYTPKKYRKE